MRREGAPPTKKAGHFGRWALWFAFGLLILWEARPGAKLLALGWVGSPHSPRGRGSCKNALFGWPVHPLRFWIAAVGFTGLEHSAGDVMADQLRQAGGALQ